ncbi:MAG: FMN-binding protein [Clostridiales bacterium]|nr:FMN-binding protein [Clostridiales bacterium]
MYRPKTIALVLLICIGILVSSGCAVTKKPPSKKGETPKSNQSEKAPTAEEKQEQTPNAQDKLDGPTTAKNVKDGKYEGKTEKDERGNYGIAKITVKDGKISEAEYTEYTEDDKPKTKESGYDYQQAMDAFDKLPDILVEKQDLTAIDTYAGATGSTKTFKAAVMKALEQGSKK